LLPPRTNGHSHSHGHGHEQLYSFLLTWKFRREVDNVRRQSRYPLRLETTVNSYSPVWAVSPPTLEMIQRKEIKEAIDKDIESIAKPEQAFSGLEKFRKTIRTIFVLADHGMYMHV
jgi:hypothetical protein